MSATVSARNARRRESARDAGPKFKMSEWLAVLEKHGFKCLMCGASAKERTIYPDHIVPLSAGGSNDISNIQPLCIGCNSMKGTQVVDLRVPDPKAESGLTKEDAAALLGVKERTIERYAKAGKIGYLHLTVDAS